MTQARKTILCIDDDRDFLDSMRLILEANDYIMETANSAEEGLRKYKSAKPDLVLVDLMMEEVDSGVNFVKELRVAGNPPPILMLSSVGDNLSISTDYAQLGLSGVLQKPVNPTVLLATLKNKLR